MQGGADDIHITEEERKGLPEEIVRIAPEIEAKLKGEGCPEIKSLSDRMLDTIVYLIQLVQTNADL